MDGKSQGHETGPASGSLAVWQLELRSFWSLGQNLNCWSTTAFIFKVNAVVFKAWKVISGMVKWCDRSWSRLTFTASNWLFSVNSNSHQIYEWKCVRHYIKCLQLLCSEIQAFITHQSYIPTLTCVSRYYECWAIFLYGEMQTQHFSHFD